MSTTTTNYGLIKPDTTDPILIGQLNDNADAIDAALKENADAIENKPDAADIPTPSTAAPAMDGTAAAGTSTDYARADHVHPSDTSKQDALTTAQLAAVNSGIDSAKVDQIETNKNNISSKCIYCTCSTASSTAAKVVNAPNGFVLQSGCIIGVLFSNTNAATNVTLNVGGTGAISIAYGISRPYTGAFTKITGSKDVVNYYMYDGSYWVFLTNSTAYSNMSQSEASAGSSTTDRLITAKVLSDTIDEKIDPLENNISKDEAALVELVDGGAKNIFEVPTPTVTNNGVQFTISNGVITATILSETRTDAAVFNIADSLNLKENEEYIFMVGLPSGASSSTYFYDVYDASWANRDVYSITRTLESSRKRVRFVIAKEYTGAVGTTIIAKPMICTKAAWNISQTYQPYRPSYQELYEMVKALQANQ